MGSCVLLGIPFSSFASLVLPRSLSLSLCLSLFPVVGTFGIISQVSNSIGSGSHKSGTCTLPSIGSGKLLNGAPGQIGELNIIVNCTQPGSN